MIRVLIADDEALIRTAIVALLDLEDDISVIAQADNGDDAIALATKHGPDIVLVDLEMPPRTGSMPPSASWPTTPRPRRS